MKRSIIVAIVVLLLASLLTAGCGDKSTSTTASSPSVTTGGSPGATTNTSDGVPSAAGPGPFTEPDYLDPQPVDLAAITNLDQAALSDAQKEILARQSFVGVAAGPESAHWKFWHIYEDARYKGLPVLVTTDSMLNAYHGLFDTLLQRMEEGALYQKAIEMTQLLWVDAINQYSAAGDPALKEDALHNVAYFAVAQSLLSGEGPALPAVRAPAPAGLEAAIALAEAELALIEGAAGTEESPILGYTEDYTQYTPRGHYTRSETLKQYFKTLVWYGRAAFFINEREPDITAEEALSLTRRAILISSALTGEAKLAWLAVYEPTSFLVGRADDITVDDMESILTEVFGTAQPKPNALTDDSKIAAVRQKINELPAPKILSGAVRAEGDTENREESERSFRVMGARYIPDSYAFQQLVWAYVGTTDSKRDLPMGLDIMTVLGSDQAYKIAKEDFGQNRYKNWQEQIEKVNSEFAGRDPDLWPANLYTGWLESLQQVMAFPADGAPDFMKSRVWARKSLNAALGSWTELRHDTILYAKQSVTAEGDGGEAPETPGYVEPYPAFYAKIAELATTLREGLLDYELVDSEAANKLETMIWLAETLASIAGKELAGEELTAEETATIIEYGHYLEMLEQFDDESGEGRTLSPSAEKSPLVADVHSSYNSRTALQEGTGYPVALYAAFEVNGALQLFVGASYAYYEFTVPIDARMTDEEWITVLDTGQAPPRPAWTNEWIAEE